MIVFTSLPCLVSLCDQSRKVTARVSSNISSSSLQVTLLLFQYNSETFSRNGEKLIEANYGLVTFVCCLI